MKTLYKLLAVFCAVCFLAACEQEIEPNSGVTDYVPDPSKIPTGVTTGELLDNLGTSVILASSVSGDGGSVLLDNGVIVSEATDFTIASQKITIQAADTATIGNFEVTVTGLKKSTTYYYRAYSYNADGIAYGSIKSFTTLNVTFSPYKSDFAPNTAAVADWVFDRYTGYDPDGVDLVWFSTEIGTTSVASYWGGEDLTLISPLIRIANSADTLSFYFYAGGYGSPQTKVKVYITEDLDNYGAPVKDWTLPGGGARTSIPMDAYFEKSVYVVIVIEAGDFILYRFSIAPTTNAAALFS
ncbi:MAG: hypothetical protein LBR10_15510 [Prevotellaceae bacterium]|jgi:hypothetical protein|nr:hypothetical protein [Prevotellaceae bacterium]